MSGVIWIASSVYTIHVPIKEDNWNGFGVVCLKKINPYFKFIKISKVTDTNQGLLIYHFQAIKSGETIPLKTVSVCTILF
jgi:hypothetical protein